MSILSQYLNVQDTFLCGSFLFIKTKKEETAKSLLVGKIGSFRAKKILAGLASPELHLNIG